MRRNEICWQFENRNWDARSVNNEINWFKNTRSICKKEGNVRPITVDTTKNQIKVETLASS